MAQTLFAASLDVDRRPVLASFRKTPHFSHMQLRAAYRLDAVEDSLYRWVAEQVVYGGLLTEQVLARLRGGLKLEELMQKHEHEIAQLEVPTAPLSLLIQKIAQDTAFLAVGPLLEALLDRSRKTADVALDLAAQQAAASIANVLEHWVEAAKVEKVREERVGWINKLHGGFRAWITQASGSTLGGGLSPKLDAALLRYLQTLVNVSRLSDRGQLVEGLWQQLSTFDVLGVDENAVARLLTPTGSVDSIIAVATNLLTRGLPTRASLHIESKLSDRFALTERYKDTDRGTVRYPVHDRQPLNPELLVDALHPVDPSAATPRDYYDYSDLESDFEKAFIDKYLQGQPVLPQLLQKQRPTASLVGLVLAQPVIARGRVDFSLETAAATTYSQINKFKRPSKPIRRGQVHVVEIDGAAYHVAAKDEARDHITANLGHLTHRIKQHTAFEDRDIFLAHLNSQDFMQRYVRNFRDECFAERPTTQLVLVPLAVARVQRVILGFLASRAWTAGLREGRIRTLRLGIIERDIRAGQLAVDDLQLTLDRLYAMSKDAAASRVKIDLELLDPDDLSEHRGSSFDLLLDHAMLRRSGIWAQDREPLLGPNHLRLRSCHYVTDEATRQVLSAMPIRYGELVRPLPNERYEPIAAIVDPLRAILGDVFRKSDFRQGQLPILHRALRGQSVIGLLPTGGGKSLTYQLAALLQPGTCIVVDPIRALMSDQYRGLLDNGITQTAYVNSTLDTAERQFVQEELRSGKLQFVFVSPERFVIKEFRDTLASMKRAGNYTSYVVIDEAHCVSEWGHDFRVPYLNLGVNAQTHAPTADARPVPLFGLTATASFDVLADIERELQIVDSDGNAVVRSENSIREEVNYRIERVAAAPSKGQAPSVWLPNELVGQPKQRRAHAILADVEAALVPYDEEGALRQNLRYGVKNYMPTGTQTAVLEHPDGPDRGLETYVEQQYQGLRLDPARHFGSADGRYRYGAIVFTPHRRGWLGIENGRQSSGMFGRVESDHLSGWGYFMGASDEDGAGGGGKAALLEANSFRHMKRFILGEAPVMVATKAFGMGIDKPDVRATIHLCAPGSIESYVQEAGRLARDGRTGLSVVLYNDEQIPTAAGANPKAINVDAAVLDFFFKGSFKGEMKERTVLYELRNRLHPQTLNNGDAITKAIVQGLGAYESLRFNIGNNGRLYCNLDGVNPTPNINLKTGQWWDFQNFPDLRTALASRLPQELQTAGAEAMNEFLRSTAAAANDLAGIEARLSRMTVGTRGRLEVSFRNKYYPLPGHDGDLSGEARGLLSTAINKYKDELDDTLDNAAEIKEALRQCGFAHNEAYKSSLTWEELVEQSLPERPAEGTLAPEVLEKAELTRAQVTAHLTNTKDRGVLRLQMAYYAPRGPGETLKAIYRLSSIGIVDTYTIDYHNDLVHLSFTKHDDGYYFEQVERFLARYTSPVRARKETEALRARTAPLIAAERATAIGACLEFLTDYIYDTIRAKRRRAIDDMLKLCRTAIEIDDPQAQNRLIRDEIYYYFNAKYSRQGYVERDGPEAHEASLLDDLQAGTFGALDLCRKFVGLLELGDTEFVNNCKHLRGSTMRLLRSHPTSPELMFLKGYALIVLAQTTAGLASEARAELRSAFSHWLADESSDLPALRDLLAASLARHVDTTRLDYRTLVDEAFAEAQLLHSAHWLMAFNQQFLKDYA